MNQKLLLGRKWVAEWLFYLLQPSVNKYLMHWLSNLFYEVGKEVR